MRRERMTESMATRLLEDSRREKRTTHRILAPFITDMVTTNSVSARIYRQLVRGKEPKTPWAGGVLDEARRVRLPGGAAESKPAEFSTGVWKLKIQRIWQINSGEIRLCVSLPDRFDLINMIFQIILKLARQRQDSILAPLSLPYRNSALVEIQILDAQLRAFSDSQTTTIHQLRFEKVSSFEMAEHRFHFVVGEYLR